MTEEDRLGHWPRFDLWVSELTSLRKQLGNWSESFSFKRDLNVLLFCF